MLASLTELKSYYIRGRDGEIGRIDDLCLREDEGPQLLFAGDLIDIYGVQAEGQEIAILRDLIVDGESWTVPYLVLDVASSGQHVLLASDYVQTIELAARRIHVALPTEALVHGPVLTAEEPITPALERSLKQYYDAYSR